MSEYIKNNYNYLPAQHLSRSYDLRTASNPVTQQQQISFGAKEEMQKEGMSKGAKWGIGLGLTALAAGGIYLATKGKVGGKAVKELAEHVEFKEAKTVEEAKKFAEDKFGVYYYDIDDVSIINYTNEWISKIYNQAQGKVNKNTYPRFIGNMHNSDGYDAPFCLCDGIVKKGKTEGYILGVNVDTFKHFDKFLEKVLEVPTTTSAEEFCKKHGNGYDTAFVRDFISKVNKFDNKTATFEEKINLYESINKIRDGEIINGELVPAKISKFRDLWHELGHMRHQASTKNYNMMKKVEEFKAKGQPVSDITMDFVTDMNIQETAVKVSEYATESPLEFVAEVFAGLQEGRTFSDDVMALYKKYNGPMLP